MISTREDTQATSLSEEERINRLIKIIFFVKRQARVCGLPSHDDVHAWSQVVATAKQDQAQIETFNDLLTQSQLEEVDQDSELYASLYEALTLFQKKYNDYLNLTVCSSTNRETIAVDYQEQFKIFLGLFVPYCSSIFDLTHAHQAWEEWLHSQPIQSLAELHAKDSRNNIIEAAQDNCLSNYHLLTDRDIRLALKAMGLDKTVRVAMLAAADIGSQLDFVRQANQNAKAPYTVFFILNVSGYHWVDLTVTVDPKTKQIAATYHDSLELNIHQKAVIQEELQKALACENHAVHIDSIEGKAQQRDAWSCGYHALFDIANKPELKKQVLSKGYADFLSLQPSSHDFAAQARDEIFSMILEHANQGQEDSIKIVIDNIAAKKSKQKAEQTREEWSEAQKEIDKLVMLDPDQPFELDIEILLKPIDAVKQQAFLACYLTALKRNNSVKKITLKNVSSLTSELREELLSGLAQYPYFIEFTTTNDETLDAKLAFLVLRNKVIKGFNLQVNAADEDLNLEKEIVEKIWFETKSTHIRLAESVFGDIGYFKYHRDDITKEDQNKFALLNEYIALAGNDFFAVVLSEMIKKSNQALPGDFNFKNLIINNQNFKNQAIINGEKIDILNRYITQLPLTEINFIEWNNKAESDSDGELLFESFIKLIENLNSSKIEKLELNFLDKKIFKSEHLQKILKLVETHKIRATIFLVYPVKSQAETDELEKFTTRLHNIVAKNKREYQKSLRPEKVKPAVEAAVFSHEAIKDDEVRPCKKTLKTVVKNRSLHKQVVITKQQHEQRQVQQQLQINKNNNSKRTQKQKIGLSGLYGTIHSSELVRRNNIHTSPYTTYYQQASGWLKEFDLVPLWDKFTGAEANQLTFGIKYMTKAAAIQFVNNAEHFHQGTNFNRLLPVGFFLQSTPSGEIVLNYDPSFRPTDIKPNPLRIKQTKKMPKHKCLGDESQFGLEAPPAKSAKFFNIEYATDDVQAKEALFKMMRAEDEDLANHIIEKYAVFFAIFSVKNIKSLWPIFYTEGSVGVDVFLEKLQAIYDVEIETHPVTNPFYGFFKDFFLDTSDNWLELMSEHAQSSLNKLATMSADKRKWWIELTAKHVSVTGWADLHDLLESFEYFCQQFERITHQKDLPSEMLFTQTQGGNIKVIMDHILFILEKTCYPEEQIKELAKIGMSNTDAFYAYLFDGFNFVSKEMGFGPDDVNKRYIQDNSYRVTIQHLIDAINRDANKDEINTLCLRYLGTENIRASYETYLVALGVKIQGNKWNADNFKSIFGFSDKQVNCFKALYVMSTCNRRSKGEDILSICDDQSLNRALWRLEKNDPKKLDDILLELLSWQMLDPRLTYTESLMLIKIFLNAQDCKKIFLQFKKFLSLCKEPFLYALKKYSFIHNNPKYSKEKLNLEEYVEFLQGFENVKSISNVTKGKIASIFATMMIDTKQYSHQSPELFSAVSALKFAMGELLNDQDKIGRFQHLVNILADLNVEDDVKSDDLPTIDDITALFQLLAEDDYQDYQSIAKLVQQKLPHCVFKSSVSSQEAYQSVDKTAELFDANVIAKKLENFGIKEEEQYKAKSNEERISKLFAQVQSVVSGGGFAGNKLLLAIRGIVWVQENKAKASILRKLKDIKLDQAYLQALLHDKLFPVFEQNQLQKCMINFFNYQNNIQPLLDTLKQINNKWPEQLEGLLVALCECDEGINKGKPSSLEFLREQLKELMALYKEEQVFPVSLIKVYLQANAHPEIFAKLISVVTNSDMSIADKEKFITIISSLSEELAQEYINSLMDYFNETPLLFTSLLDIYINLKNPGDLEAVKKAFDTFRVTQPILNVDVMQSFLGIFKFIGLANGNDFIEITNRILNQPERKGTIISILANLIRKPNLEYKYNDLQSLITLLQDDKINAELLKKIAYTCQSHSHLTLDRVVLLLKKSTHEIEEEIVKINCTPHGERNLSQFDTSHALDVITHIVNFRTGKATVKEQVLFSTQQENLYQDFLVVNALGATHAIKIRQEMTDDHAQKYPAAKDLLDNEIVELLMEIKSSLSHLQTSEAEKMNQRLRALALLREMMYRSTEKHLFPNSTQMITVLHALEQGAEVSTLNEVRTGQGKSVITALFAAMLNLEGQTVDVCTANLELASRDLAEFTPFFQRSGFICNADAITATSAASDYKVGGINYSDASSLSLFRAQMRIEGTLPVTEKISLVLDEADHTILDDNIEYRASLNLNPGSDPAQNVYAWIYPLINDFMISFTAPPIVPTRRADDVAKLRTYLAQRCSTSEREIVKELSYKQLDTWIDAAHEATKRKENEDFVIKQEGNAWVAKPLDEHGHITDATEGLGVQQFLHARLNKQYESKKYHFKIEPEEAPIATTTSKNFIDFYLQKGRVIGLTGTIGSVKERNEYAKKYGFRQFRFPTHAFKPRADITYLADDENWRERLVVREVLKRLNYKKRWWHLKRNTDPQPVLIAVRDIAQADRIYRLLRESLGHHPRLSSLQLYTAKDAHYTDSHHVKTFINEIPPDRENPGKNIETQVVERAGEHGVITISTLLGRGIDIDHGQHPRGLCVIQPFLAPPRPTGQIKGRTGRKKDTADYVQIITRAELIGQYEKPADIQATAEQMNKLAKRERLFREAFGDIKQELFEKFMSIHQLLEKANDNSLLLAFKRLWRHYLEELEQKWSILLQTKGQADSEKEDVALRQEKIAACIDTIKQTAITNWAAMIDDLNKILQVRKNDEISISRGLEFARPVSQDTASDLSCAAEHSQPVRMFNPDTIQVDQAFLDLGMAETIGLSKQKKDQYQSIATRVLLGRIQAALQQRRELKFNRLDISNDENIINATKAILKTLLNAIQHAFLSDQPLYLANLMKIYSEMMGVVRGDYLLQQPAYDIHVQHYLKLTDSKNVAEQRYLQVFSINMSILMANDCFVAVALPADNNWKCPNRQNRQEKIEKELALYQRGEWFRYQSKDRRENVASLLQEIKKSKVYPPSTLLMKLNKARQNALETDVNTSGSYFFQRNLSESRYLQLLERLRHQLISSLTPEEIDQCLAEEWQDFWNILVMINSLKPKISFVATCLNTFQNESEPTVKYQAMMTFLATVKHQQKIGGIDKTYNKILKQLLYQAAKRAQDIDLFMLQGRDILQYRQQNEKLSEIAARGAMTKAGGLND